MTKISVDQFRKNSKIIRRKYSDIYHLNEKIECIYNNLYVTEWSLFKKNKNLEMYFSSANKPILSSKNGNTIEDLNNFVKYIENKRSYKYRNLK